MSSEGEPLLNTRESSSIDTVVNRRRTLGTTREENSVEVDEVERSALNTPPTKRVLPKPFLRSKTMSESVMAKKILPLNRKHSSGDLHSRLKTRKLLGVGETDDGDVHRSKLSQILGHSEQLFVKLPKGLRSWQLFLAIFHTFSALWALIFPHHFLTYLLSAKAEESATVPIRCYGAVLIAFSVMSWCAFRSGEKDVIRSSLLASALYFIIQTFVTMYGNFRQDDSVSPRDYVIILPSLSALGGLSTLAAYWLFTTSHHHHSRSSSIRYK